MAAVTANLHYFVPPADGTKPWSDINRIKYGKNFDTLHPNERGRNWTTMEPELSIRGLRGKEDTVSLDKEGFQYIRHTTEEKEFIDDVEALQGYYDESIALIKKVTGANRAVIFDHTIRRQTAVPTPSTPSTRQPVSLVHVDQTPEAARNRVKRHLPESDVPNLLSKRFQIINLWRPIGNPAFRRPLALCDFQTIDTRSDLVPTTLKYPESEGETFSVKFNEKHQWYYVKGMTPEEVVFIKCFDSIQDGSVATLTPHTSFDDPTAPADAPLRQSIELRLLVFYDQSISEYSSS